jgi:acyl carrier protein
MTRDLLRVATVEAIAELTGCSANKISDTDDLVDDLGVDSMVAVNLVVAIEDRVRRTLSDGYESSLVDVRTVGSLVERLASAFDLANGEGGPSQAATSELHDE